MYVVVLQHRYLGATLLYAFLLCEIQLKIFLMVSMCYQDAASTPIEGVDEAVCNYFKGMK